MQRSFETIRYQPDHLCERALRGFFRLQDLDRLGRACLNASKAVGTVFRISGHDRYLFAIGFVYREHVERADLNTVAVTLAVFRIDCKDPHFGPPS
jgi:hypothetical protein